jgi:Zn-dependent protease
MPDAWQIGRILGIPLRLHVSWFLVFALVSWSLAVGYFPAQLPGMPAWTYWVTAAVAALVLFASVILHELGHSLVARRRGVAIAGITLFVFGGVSQMREEPPDARTELQVALAGPLISVGLALLFGLAAYLTGADTGPTALSAFLAYLAMINATLAVFNMIPAFPLDGGRVLRAGLWRVRGDVGAATRAAAGVSRFVALAMIAVGIFQLLGGRFGGLWLALIGWFILQAGSAAAAQASLRQGLGGLRVREAMARDLAVVEAGTSVADVIAQYFVRYMYGGYPVVRGRTPIGVVTLGEVRQVPAEQRAATPVEAIMMPLRAELAVAPDTSVVEALDRMTATNTGRLLVLDEGRLVGLLTMRGLLHRAGVKAALGA